jgi:hypothetical protein
MQLPVLSSPVPRELLAKEVQVCHAGVEPSQSVCDNLTGMSQQICYALEYGISE